MPQLILNLVISFILLPLVTACQGQFLKFDQSTPFKSSVPVGIIGGHPADIQNYSFLVNIWLNNPRENFHEHLCGGSLIASQWVLTAAHCVLEDIAEGESRPVKPQTLELYLESSKISGEGGQKLEVEKVIVHPDFSWPKNDVALLFLKKPVTNVKPISLDTKDYEASLVGQKATVLGWGLVDFNGNEEGLYLQKTNVSLISREACGRDEFPVKRGWQIERDMICAATQFNKVAACPGDSGGPLVTEKDSVLVQIGIVSWGTACSGKVSNSNVEGYASVANLQKWIQSQISK